MEKKEKGKGVKILYEKRKKVAKNKLVKFLKSKDQKKNVKLSRNQEEYIGY